MERKVILICIDGLAAYYLDDPRCKMPNVRGLINQGTKAEKMKVAYPSSTWPMNTSIVTGVYPKKHGVLGNWVVERETRQVKEHFGDRSWDKEDVVQVPTLYDLAHQKGVKTAAVCWPVTRGAKHIDFNIPEFYEQELFEKHCTPTFWNELKEHGLPVDHYGEWSKDHARGKMQDWLTAEVAKHLIRNHKPGLMMLHFLVADSFQHDYGTRAPEVFWALDYIDERIGQIIGALKEEGVYENTDLFIVSDHGFMDAHSVICPNVLFKQKGWYDEENPTNSKVVAVSNGGVGYVYILDEEYPDELASLVKEELQQTEGVECVFENEHFSELGFPRIEEHSHQPDFIFEAETGYFVYFGAEGDKVIDKNKYTAMHGYLPEKEELKAVFIAHGPSIRSGLSLPEINIVDIAPTVAKIIGLELEDADGKVLEAMINVREVKV
ncbi:alkaline phosphatase family protein [Ferviditalea candida]|uniref:Ectonucleotide pyrophosphatase/phosphodiesterase n=1 Tax=Ferviditalea candida TaxID=3108399 RepID=A0ABU5ZMH6_9BACL|nr:ectonucleotide pyrophosphatase/phosphodiesterase [Paenibacillaceae bacterium T2]